MKVIACLGNPGSEYSTTRHNVGWWLAERLAESWGLDRFRRDGNALVATGRFEGEDVRVVKPTTYMNHSGQALTPYRRASAFSVPRDLLVVVDEVALEPGRARFRPGGSAGGHNGLKSVQASLGTQEYARLRIGVGAKPPGADLADWVLSPPPRADRAIIMELLPELVEGVGVWAREGIEAAMNRYNR
ncbi:MAG: aminoacyl-tRNA hydrolase [Gemmatimonadetes bacterium]|nr:aminoacyl-tRNA hydrolase [Gemmatimonadota bacterium]